MILVCVYTPVWDDCKFIAHLFSSLSDIDSHYPILGGDFNLMQDPRLDRSSSRSFVLSKSAPTLKTFTDLSRSVQRSVRAGLSDS